MEPPLQNTDFNPSAGRLNNQNSSTERKQNQHFGASPTDWDHLQALRLTSDLLPVVCNPNKKISPHSRVKMIGKVPSLLNRVGLVVGIPGWTRKSTQPEEVTAWSKMSDYGICVQTRATKAFDLDVIDEPLVQKIISIVEAILGVPLPRRGRPNSPKCLLLMRLPDKLAKRTLRTSHGVIEFLGHGQQFVAVGTHTSGVRYEWDGGLPDIIPDVSLDQFEALWAALQAAFGAEDTTEGKPTERTAILAESVSDDPISNALYDTDSVLALGTDGKMSIVCPWEDEHSADTGLGATVYFPPHTGGYRQGNFKCLHAHCEGRNVHDLKAFLGITESEVIAHFDDLSSEQEPTNDDDAQAKFSVSHVYDFQGISTTLWLIKNVIPKASLGMMYGPSTAGKSFAMLDLMSAIARGVDWRGHPSVRGRVVYVCAEGQTGFRKRCAAYIKHYGLERADFDLFVVPHAPNLLKKSDVAKLSKTLNSLGQQASVIIIDTLATAMPGGDENSGVDTGAVLSHCKQLSLRFDAMVMLVHHAGKDAARGARGWSGLRAACDVEIEVININDERIMRITKQKDGEQGGEFGFRLLPVVVGEDEDGDPITSCVVEHTDTRIGELRAKNRPLGPNGDAIVDAVITVSGLLDDKASVDMVIDHAITLRGGDKAGMRSNLRRALNGLVKKGVCSDDDGFVRLLDHQSITNRSSTY